MSPRKSSLGQAELKVLKYVTDHAPISVGEVAQFMSESAGLARTTILTVMERLRTKGYLTRRKQKGVYRYSPKLDKANLMQGLVEEFVAKTLGGSVSPFLAYLAESKPLSDEELSQLREIVDELEDQGG